LSIPLGAKSGVAAGDPYAVALVFAGFVVCVAIAALSYQRERAYSASVIYLALGVAAGAVLHLLGGERIDPIADAELVGRIAEGALLVAVFTAGLRVERTLFSGQWRSVVILIALVMPACVALIALFGTQVMGLSLGAALVLGAVLAPTDPVLAGDIGVGAPGEQADHPEEARFAISAEAGLNDGLAAPLVLFGLVVAAGAASEDVLEWALADVLLAIPVGVLVGALGGYGLAALVHTGRERGMLDTQFDGFVAIAAPLLLYGVAEALGGIGFVAGFVGGLGFRRYEFGHEYNRELHDGAEVFEKLLELAVILVLGSTVTLTALGEPGVAGWLLAPLLLLVIRPAAVFACFAPMRALGMRSRLFLAWFGVRGVAALYFCTLAVQTGILSPSEEGTVVWTALVCVMVSILVHGMTSDPLGRKLDEEVTPA